jgi:glycine cleavage system H protein
VNIPANLRYTSSHEWIRKELDGTLTIGITDHAQAALGDLVFIELPKVGRKLGAGEAAAVVESVKAASDVYAPVAGTVAAANADVQKSPETVNADAYAAWLYRLTPDDIATVDGLLDARGYQAVIAES